MSIMTTGFPRRHRLTAAEYHLMGEAGVLRPDARVELIEGELIDMAPIGNRHAGTVEQLVDLLRRGIADRAMVRTQQPIALDAYSVPQPDVAVVARRDDFYKRSHPQSHDVLLIVEVADSTLAFDRDVKAPMYARSGVRELWIVDVAGQRVARFLSPSGDVDAVSDSFGAQDSIVVGAFPDVRINLRAIFTD